MDVLKFRNMMYKYFICICVTLITLFILMNYIFKEPIITKDEIKSSNISFTDEITNIDVNYPRFNNDKINKIITDYIYEYVKDFKSHTKETKSLKINYDLYFNDDYVNIVFNINNSRSIIKNKNILIDLKKEKQIYISNIYEKDYLKNEIDDIVYYKYSTQIYNKIKNSNINNNTYIIDDNKIAVYFNNINFNEIDYIPNIVIQFNETVSKPENNINNNAEQKYISFTFDDGPSKHTIDLLKILENNNSSATFFMLGNKMKYYPEIVNEIYNSNSEVASHGYSHKNLTEIKEEDMYEEINSTLIKYNEITGSFIKYLRPPYGKYNDKLLNNYYSIVLWNIDTKDWLSRNSTKIYNNIIKKACDGCIVLMHDIYPETIEAVKMAIPKLNEMGYSVVNISELIKIKNYQIKDKEIINKIN